MFTPWTEWQPVLRWPEGSKHCTISENTPTFQETCFTKNNTSQHIKFEKTQLHSRKSPESTLKNVGLRHRVVLSRSRKWHWTVNRDLGSVRSQTRLFFLLFPQILLLLLYFLKCHYVFLKCCCVLDVQGHPIVSLYAWATYWSQRKKLVYYRYIKIWNFNIQFVLWQCCA